SCNLRQRTTEVAVAVTEAKWLAYQGPALMLDFLRQTRASSRKLRLFACACYRRARRLPAVGAGLPAPAPIDAAEPPPVFYPVPPAGVPSRRESRCQECSGVVASEAAAETEAPDSVHLDRSA